jgi:hypothetical protein
MLPKAMTLSRLAALRLKGFWGLLEELVVSGETERPVPVESGVSIGVVVTDESDAILVEGKRWAGGC